MGSFSVTHWVITFAIGYFIFRFFKGIATGGKSGKAMFCPACGIEAPAKRLTRGSIWIEIILWLCFLVPGLIYSVWRLSSKATVCSSCGHDGLIPSNSPIAVAAKRKLMQES